MITPRALHDMKVAEVLDRETRGASILLPCILAAAIALCGLLSLDKFSVNWDAAVGDLFFGQRYFSYFTSFDSRYLDFDADPYPPGFTPDLSMTEFRARPWEHYPVSSTLATMTGVALSKGAGVFDEFDAIFAFNPILGAVFAFILFRLVERWTDRGVAFFAVAFLFLSPRITYHLVVNIKDFPEMVFFSLALLLFFDGHERGRPLRLLASGVVLGLALGTKANALFAPIVVGLFLVARGVPESWERRRAARLALVLTAGLVALVVMVAAWPYLWSDPWNRFVDNLSYLATRSVDSESDHSHPLATLAFTSPPALIVAFAIGLIPLYGRLRRRDPLALLLVAWIAVVTARLVAPGAVNFDGVRHFLEIFPPLAIIAALGIDWLVIRITSRFPAQGKRRLIHASLAVLFLVPIATSVVRMHPFQVAYWNFLVGGPEGAYRRGLPQWGDYWATSYRLGLDWINRNAPLESVLVVPIAEHTVRIVAAERLRPDIRLAHVSGAGSPELVGESFDSLEAMSATQPVLVMFAPRTEWSNEIVTYCQQKLEPVASWGIGTVDYLVIYRFEGAGLRGSNSLPVGASTVPP